MISRRVQFNGSVVALGLALIASTGLLEAKLFSQESTLRYALTVVGPLALLALLVTQRRTWITATMLVITAPFYFVVTFAGVSVSPLLLCLVATALGVWWTSAVQLTGPRPALRLVAPMAAALALPSLLNTHHAAATVSSLFIVAAVCMSVTRVAREGARRIIAIALVAAAAGQATLGTYEALTKARLNLYGTPAANGDYFFTYESAFRPAAAMPDPISLGNLLALALPLTLCLVLSARRRAEAIALSLSGMLIALCLAFTLSRMSWIAAAVGLVVALICLPPRKAITGALGLVAAGTASVVLAVTIGGQAMRDRFTSILNPTGHHVATQEGDLDRRRIWHVAVDTLTRHRISGVGFGNISEVLIGRVDGASIATHAHSVYLNVLAEGGLLAGAALLLLLMAACIDLRRGLSRDRLLYAGLAGSGAALLVGWSTDYTVRLAPVLALVCVYFSLLASANSDVATLVDDDDAAASTPGATLVDFGASRI